MKHMETISGIKGKNFKIHNIKRYMGAGWGAMGWGHLAYAPKAPKEKINVPP